MWKSVKPTTMQEFGNYCNQMQVNDTLTLRDTRDNNEYTIAKLKDNKCWMTQNLRLQNKTLSVNDSDIASTFILPASNNVGFNSENVAYVYVPDSTHGGYYSWFAATAGEGISSFPQYSTAKYSICPKGWRMPTGNEYISLVNIYDSNRNGIMLQPPLNFILGGGYMNGTYSCDGQTTAVEVWASTITNHASPNFLYLYASGVKTHCGNGLCGCSNGCSCQKYTGFPIRCISK